MKRIISLICIVVIVLTFSLNTYASNSIFIDVDQNYWAVNEIKYFAEQNIISGNGDGTFEPESGVTREQFCKMLAITFDATLDPPANPSFSDVNAYVWSYPYVEVCKDFMTVYTNPFGGLPSFHPTEYATREDIAVALVKIMGLDANDVNDANYAMKKFTDASSISPALLPYVSLACERGLINGYPNGTFAPTKGITRAETVVLLNRATKQAATDIDSELKLEANKSYSSDGKTITIAIDAENGTKVTVDGKQTTKTSESYGNMYTSIFTYTFEQEGNKDFVIEGVKGAKTKRIVINASYKIDTPKIVISEYPSVINDKKVVLSGFTTNGDNDFVFTINGNVVHCDWTGAWSHTVSLNEGDNIIKLVATNSTGKTTTKEIKITFKSNELKLTVDSIPTTVTNSSLTIRGKVSDANYSTSLTINNEIIYLSYDGLWEKSFELSQGANTFNIIAKNEIGQTEAKTYTINLEISGPKLTVDSVPTLVANNSLTIKGTVKDVNYSTSLTINNEIVYLNHDGSWSKTVELSKGQNVFNIIAKNDIGQTISENVTVEFKPKTLEIKIQNYPEISTEQQVLLSGKITGNTIGIILYINNENISVDWDGNFSYYYNLVEGNNTIIFTAINSDEESVTKTEFITYNIQ